MVKKNSGIKMPNEQAQMTDLELQENKNMRVMDISRSLHTDELVDFSDSQLIARFENLEKGSIKYRLEQCKILREIRLRYGNDDRRFGAFISMTKLSEIHTKTISRMIQVADFFENKPIDGIGWSAAMELAAPANSKVALQVYKKVAGKDKRFVDVKQQITDLLEELNPKKSASEKTPEYANEPIEGEFTNITNSDSPMSAISSNTDAIAELAVNDAVMSVEIKPDTDNKPMFQYYKPPIEPVKSAPLSSIESHPITNEEHEAEKDYLLKRHALWPRNDAKRLYRELIGIYERMN